jgi:hypothetical protein
VELREEVWGEGEETHHGERTEKAQWRETETVVARRVIFRSYATRAEPLRREKGSESQGKGDKTVERDFGEIELVIPG